LPRPGPLMPEVCVEGVVALVIEALEMCPVQASFATSGLRLPGILRSPDLIGESPEDRLNGAEEPC